MNVLSVHIKKKTKHLWRHLAISANSKVDEAVKNLPATLQVVCRKYLKREWYEAEWLISCMLLRISHRY